METVPELPAVQVNEYELLSIHSVVPPPLPLVTVVVTYPAPLLTETVTVKLSPAETELFEVLILKVEALTSTPVKNNINTEKTSKNLILQINLFIQSYSPFYSI